MDMLYDDRPRARPAPRLRLAAALTAAHHFLATAVAAVLGGMLAGAAGWVIFEAVAAAAAFAARHPDGFSQLWITAFGLPALVCVNTGVLRWRKIGSVLGMLAQPGWYAQLILQEQWGMLPLFLCYTAAWALGLWRSFGPPARRAAREQHSAYLKPAPPLSVPSAADLRDRPPGTLTIPGRQHDQDPTAA